MEGGQKRAGLLVFISDIHSRGLQVAQGLQLTSAFYWDQNDQTCAWSKRFMDKMQRAPTMVQAGVYGAIMHHLAAIKATRSDDGPTVVKGHVRQAGGDSRLKLRRRGCSGVGKKMTGGRYGGRERDRRHGGLCCGWSAAIKPCAFGAPLRGCGA